MVPGTPFDAVVDDKADRVGVGDVNLSLGVGCNGHGHTSVQTGVAIARVRLGGVVDASRNKLDG